MDTLTLCGICVPLATYLLVLGGVNSGRRPMLIPGALDTAGVCFGLSGLVVMGPLHLVLQPLLRRDPNAALALGSLIFGLASAAVLVAQPRRLVVYNCGGQRFQEIWRAVVAALDPHVKTLANLYVLPTAGIQLRLHAFAPLCNISLVAESGPQNGKAWKQLELALLQHLAQQPRTSRRPLPLLLVATGLILLCVPLWQIVWAAPDLWHLLGRSGL